MEKLVLLWCWNKLFEKMEENEIKLGHQVDGNHYEKLKIQPFEYGFYNNLGCLEFSVVKYITRHGDKAKDRDVLKAIHCCCMLLRMRYGYDDAKLQSSLSGFVNSGKSNK